MLRRAMLVALLVLVYVMLTRAPATKETFVAADTCPKSPYRRIMQIMSTPASDSPAALLFDGMLIRATKQAAAPGLSTPQSDCTQCIGKPTDEQLKRFLVAVLGGSALQPGAGIEVPVEVPCVYVHDCRGLGAGSVIHLEFVALRAGDDFGVHYEAQLMADPLSVLWFRRQGQLPSYDAYACTGGIPSPLPPAMGLL